MISRVSHWRTSTSGAIFLSYGRSVIGWPDAGVSVGINCSSPTDPPLGFIPIFSPRKPDSQDPMTWFFNSIHKGLCE